VSTIVVADTNRFVDIKTRLYQAVQKAGHEYWEARNVDVTAHGNFLALSWSGTEEYWMALEFRRKQRNSQTKLNTGFRASEESLDHIGQLVRKSYAFCESGRYSLEAYIFFKTSNIAPAELVQMAPGLVQAFADAPLHSYFVIRRAQNAVPKGQSKTFGGWEVITPYERESEAVIKALIKQIYPEKCPPLRKTPKCVFCWIVGSILALLLAVTAGLTAYEPSRDWLLSRFDPAGQGRLDDLDSRVSELEALNRERTQIVQFNRDSDADRLSEIDARLETISGQIDSMVSLLPLPASGDAVSGRTGRRSLDAPPCLAADNGQPLTPYIIRIGETAMSVMPVHSALETNRQQSRPFQHLSSFTNMNVTERAFMDFAQPIYGESLERNCRHFVVLLETDPESASRYIDRRALVERYFYIIRPAR